MIYKIKPKRVRIDASSLCQLKCPCCPHTNGTIEGNQQLIKLNKVDLVDEDFLNPWSAHAELVKNNPIGLGYLKLEYFKKIIEENPWISHVELSNWGEIFLNPELKNIIEYAYNKKVILTAENGVNLNTAEEDILETLVKFRFISLLCSIDGATQETYRFYRIGGDFNKVIENIKKLNYYKHKYKSKFPILAWQFIIFGHNENEILKARKMAKELGMLFLLRLNVSDLYSKVNNKNLVKNQIFGKFFSRKDYFEKYGIVNRQKVICSQLWNSPQINWDGRLLGCCVNYWDDFGDVFDETFLGALNNEKINYARDMLLGIKEPKADILCSKCIYYERMKRAKKWLTKNEIRFYDMIYRIKYRWILSFKDFYIPHKYWV